jgi:hypothetical protein
MTDVHDSDILTWSERQAELLRRLAAGDPPPEVCPVTLEEMLAPPRDELPSGEF